MGKINCICDIEDQNFKTAFSVLLLSSGFFNLKNAERIVEEEGKEALEKTIYISGEREVSEEISNCFRVILTAEKMQNEGNKSPGQSLAVYRYEDFRNILKAINECFGLFPVKARVGEAERIKVMAITSISGGAGTTTLAKTIGRIMAREGEKPLYLSLSPVNPISENGDLIRVIYDLKKNREIDFSLYVSNYESIDEIGSPSVNSYLHLIDNVAMEKIIHGVKKAGYSLLILDIGNHLTATNLELLELCDYEIMVLPMRILDDNWNREKIKRITGNSHCKTFPIVNDNIGVVHEDKMHSLFADNKLGVLGFIPYQGSIDERSVDGEYGNIIRFILEGINEFDERKPGFN